MKISYNWLKNYINTDITAEEAAKILTAGGLEVEAVEEIEEIPGGLAGVLVGEVVECGKHPDADKLSQTKVNVGGEELLQIVCGAPNVAAGQKVFVATVGTKLRFFDGTEATIKRSKIRGVESCGMICAEDELGLGTMHEGIMVLDSGAIVGMAAKDYLKLKSDFIFEIGLTPNRIDAASHIGVARDLYASLRYRGYNDVSFIKPDVERFDSLSRSTSIKPITIKIDAADGAPRYNGLTFEGVVVKSSPEWMQSYLRSIGLRPINNIVDITNFILHETGQPLHAFDYDKISDSTVVVRRAKDGEKFVTLDGVEREMSKEDLMICDAQKPMCLAGVFGGEGSGVSESTKAIFLESAYFNPVSIRKSSKSHGLKTDASFRYERGADPEITIYALKRAAMLFHEFAGAKVVGDIVEFYPKKIERAKISVDFRRVENLIGKKIGEKTIVEILKYLDYEILSSNSAGVELSVPGYRVDVTRECDVIEDILRIYGYNSIELPERMSASISTVVKPDPERVRNATADMLVANGFYEMMNNSLTKSDYYAKLTTFPEAALAKILNPLSSDLNAMRQTLILNGLEVVAYNINRQHPDLKLFEFGNVYSVEPASDINDLSNYKESEKLLIVVTGTSPVSWREKRVPTDYFMVKGYVEMVLSRFGADIYDFDYTPAPADIFSEGLRYTTKEGAEIAVMGTISGKLLKQLDIKQPVYIAEISWSRILKLAKKNRIQYKELPKFPEVRRDLALLIDEKVSYADIRKVAFATERKLLKQVILFDVYRGDKIASGKKQYAVSFTLQDSEKTLTDKYVEDTMDRLLKAFMDKFGAVLR